MRNDDMPTVPGIVPGISSNAARGFRTRGERERVTTMQMSVRMREDVYERFRALADAERRTNGDMLELMMDAYIRQQGKGDR